MPSNTAPSNMPPKRPVRADDLRRFRVPAELQLAPDGESIVYTERDVDPKTDRARSRLVRVRVGDSPRLFTSGSGRDSAPRISPDGRLVAFLRARTAAPGQPKPPIQLCAIPTDGGEARVIVEADGTFGPPTWAPDSHALAFAFRRADERPHGRDSPLSIRVTRLQYKADSDGYLPRDRFSIYRVDLDAPLLRPLTDPDGDWDDLHPAWSPDGTRIAFLSNRRPERDRDPMNTDVFTIPAAGGDAVRCTRERGPVFRLAWAPNGRFIAASAVLGPQGAELSRINARLFRISPTGEAPEICLTPDLDRCTINLTIDDLWGLEGLDAAPAVSPDSRHVYLPVTDEGTTWLGRLPVDADGARTGAIERIVHDRVVVDFAVGGARLAVLTTEPTAPGRVEISDLDGLEREVIAWPLRDWCESVALREPIELRVPHRDGHEVHGWLLLPEGGGPHPLLLDIHGGPVVQFGRTGFHELQWLATRGAAVLYVNPRGSQGYGEAFSGAIHRDWADKPFGDLMCALDHVVARFPIDVERMGVLGGSYGGYMTNWTVARTDRFCAACTQRTVSSVESFIWSDFGGVLGPELDAWPWEDPELYARLSPASVVRNIDTPMLILQGLGDLRTPPDQGERLYVMLRAMGKPAEMVLFPGANHDLSRNGPTDQRIERLRIIDAWFSKHLDLGPPEADEAEAE